MYQLKLLICGALFFFVFSPSDILAQKQLTAERLFAPDRITDIQIELAPNDWDKIRNQSRSFGSALARERPKSPFEYVKGNVTIDGVEVKDVGIRKKGFLGSLNTERPSLKIKFEEYLKQSPVDGLDRLTLNNNNQDPGRICQYLCYKLFRESGTHAPRCGFAKVTVNGVYLGLYSNVEPIKSDFLTYAFNDNSGALFEGTATDFMPDWIEKFELKNDAADFSQIRGVADIFVSSASEEEKLAQLKELIDVDSFISFWAMESLIGFWDGYCADQNNFYVYRLPKNNKLYFIPWGTDSAFTDNIPIPPFRIRPRSVHAKSILPNRLYRIDETKQAYEARLMSFLDNHWDEEKLLGEIDRLESMLKDHLAESNTSFKETNDGYRRFIKGRRKAVMAEFKNGPPELLSREQVPVYFKNIGSAEITFSTKWYKSEPKSVLGTGEVTVNATLNGKKLDLKDLGVYAKTDDRDKNNASIVVIGKNSKGKQTIIGAGMPKTAFQAGDSPIGAIGVIIQPGMFGMLNADMKMMVGTITLDEASLTPGEAVSGKMTFSVGEFITGENEVSK